MNIKNRLVILVIVLVIASLACSVERVLNPSQPTPTATYPFIPTDVVEPTPTPIATPEPGVRVESGDRAYFNGDYDLAIQEYTLAFENGATPEIQAAALLGLGRTYYRKGDLDNALIALTSAVSNFAGTSHQAALQFALGEVYEALNQPLDAATAFGGYLSVRPGLIDFYLHERIGDNNFQAGSYQQAIDAYVLAIQSPTIGDTLYLNMQIADAYFELGDFGTALVTYQDVASRTGNDYTKAEAIRKSGDIEVLLGNLESAYNYYHQVVNEYPLAYDAYLSVVALLDAGQAVNELNRGLINYFIDQNGFAIDAFIRYINANPSNHSDTAHYYLGLAYVANGDYQKAVDAWHDFIDEHLN
jgi:soluble lytic murein transglycosylase